MSDKKWPRTFDECAKNDSHQFWYLKDSFFRQYTTQCQLCGALKGRNRKGR